uniref:Rh family B glycoprotein n=1 Tax=Cairina moschata TaxID=8855 RepID=A0A8C3BG58_CAIMO
MAEGAAARLRLAGLCFFLQLLTIILFAAFVRYGPESDPGLCSPQSNCSRRDPEPGSGYPRFRDAHLQALLGFGFLLAFLGRYGPGSVATSLLVVAFAVQWALLAQGLFYFSPKGKIYVGAQSMVSADFCTAAVLISSGAVLGRVNPIQLLLMTLLEVPLFACNEFILLSLLGVSRPSKIRLAAGLLPPASGPIPHPARVSCTHQISDSGGSLTVHAFGAYFGLMVSRALRQPRVDERGEQQDAGRQPDAFAVLGTLYLWIFWPSFASATTAQEGAEPWALLNVYFSMAASTLAAFVLSPILYEEGALQAAQLQDAALVGAAVMGMAGEMLLTPFGALVAGFLASHLSLLGSRFLSPILSSRLKIQDTCGVHNVHGLPGVLGTLVGTLLAGLATADAYGGRMESVFPLVAQGSRTASGQAWWQLCALPLTLILAALGGSLTGALLGTRALRSTPKSPERESKVLREVPEDGVNPEASDEELGGSTLA